MALTGWNDLSAFAGTNWTSPSNAQLSDDSRAVYNDVSQDYLRCTNPGWTIPDNAIIRGFEVSIEGNGTDASATNREMEVGLTKDGTTLAGTLKDLTLNQTSDTVQTFGGREDRWGEVWDIAEVNASTFGVLLRDNDTTGAALNIDHVMVRVYYDFGFRGEWDVDFDDKEVTHIDTYLDVDSGSGGTAPADGDVVFNISTTAASKIIGVTPTGIIEFATWTLGEQHTAGHADNNNIEVCSYVDFDAEGSGGVTEADIGSAFTASGGGTRTGIIRHVKSDGSTGRIWWDPTNEGGTAVQNNDTITIDGTSRTVTASTAEVSNAWTGLANGNEIIQPQGYLNYDTETITFESESGVGRIRDKLGFVHNMCVRDVTTGATAMLVDDFEDPNATDTGRFFLIDVTGTFGDDNVIEALEEVYYITEVSGGFFIGDTVTGLASGASGIIRRLIDNGTTGTLYLSNVSGGPFNDAEALRVGGVTKGTSDATQGGGDHHRIRVGSATINQTGIFTSSVQWPTSHFYSDLQDQFDELANLDDLVPSSSQVLDQQYTMLNFWLLPFFSSRRLKKGAVNEIGTLGGTDGDTVLTNDFHLGSVNGSPNLYVQGGLDNAVLEQFWDAGTPMDILIRNKNKNADVNSGTRTWYVRPYGDLYDFFALSPVGLRNPVPLNTASDANNATAYATVQADASDNYMVIEMAWASHTINFDTGAGGTFETCDVMFNSTRNTAVMVARVPDSFVSGTDLHVAAHGQDITDWGDGDALEILDYFDFDGQVSQFVIGEAIENGGDSWNATVRWVQQFGDTVGRVWFSGESGTLVDDDTVQLNGGGTVRATAQGAKTVRAAWTGQTNTATPETADTTVAKDIGNGTDNPYNVVFNLNGATVLEFYEWAKFITEERAGGPNDPGSLLYPDNTSTEGRVYQKAASTYGAADLKKVAPLGTQAGTLFQGARGIFIENMAAGDVQNYELIDADGTTRTPPNFQNVTVTGLVVGDSVLVGRRFEKTPSGTITFATADDTIVINSGGDFELVNIGDSLTFAGTASNNATYTVKSVDSQFQVTVNENVTNETTSAGAATITSDALDKAALTSPATGNNSGDADFVVDETIPSDYPASGSIVVQHISGSEIYEDVLTYTSFTASTFTLSGTLPRTYDANARAWVPLIRKVATATSESQQIVYSADFPILTNVRLKGIQPFTVNGTFGSTGATVAAIRTTDTIVE